MWSVFENTSTSVGYLPTDSNCKRIYLNIYVEVAVNYRRCHKKDLLAIWYNYSLFSYHAAVKREKVILTPKTLANCFNISFNIRLILWKLSPPPPSSSSTVLNRCWNFASTTIQHFLLFLQMLNEVKTIFPLLSTLLGMHVHTNWLLSGVSMSIYTCKITSL